MARVSVRSGLKKLRPKAFGPVLREFMSCTSSEAWLLSHYGSEKPLVALIPLYSMSIESDEFTKLKDLVKEKPCTVVTNELHSLVPDFREIVKLINSTPDEEVDESRRLILRNMRPKLNRILQLFLQNLESSWLGSLSDILLGNFSAPGLPSFFEGCHIRFGSCSNMSLRENLPPDKLLVEGSNERKEPMILVMGSDIQVLPWESLPALERQEVYRMPSWLSISITLSRSAGCKIDPQNAYCLMPSKDHPTDLVQIMTRWLNNHYIKVCEKPESEDLEHALASHDLFIYLGHGSGAQFIDERSVENLDGGEFRQMCRCFIAGLF